MAKAEPNGRRRIVRWNGKGKSSNHWRLRIAILVLHAEEAQKDFCFRASNKAQAKSKGFLAVRRFLSKYIIEESACVRLRARLSKAQYDVSNGRGSSPVFILKFDCTYVEKAMKTMRPEEMFKEIKEKGRQRVERQALESRRDQPLTRQTTTMRPSQMTHKRGGSLFGQNSSPRRRPSEQGSQAAARF